MPRVNAGPWPTLRAGGILPKPSTSLAWRAQESRTLDRTRTRVDEEALLQILGRAPRRLRAASSLLRELGASPRQRRRLLRLLRTLTEEGRVERVGRRYRLRRADGLLEGTLVEAGGTARVAEGRRSHPVSGARGAEARAGARSGDRVLALREGGRRGGVEVLQVLEGARPHWIGILEPGRRGAVVGPYRDSSEWEIPIPRAETGGARAGDVVVVAPLRETRGGVPQAGRVVRRLGRPGDPDADFEAVVWHRRLPVEFPAAAQAEAAEMEPVPTRAELERRVDLRRLPFCTIDPANARDHDDALSVKPDGAGGARLWVAIADVAHYVAEGGALDAAARERGNSVYFPDRAIPMLPERLSGEIGSLRPDRDRLVMTVELSIDASGRVRRRSFYPGVIRSRARLSYDEAAAAMEGQGSVGELDGQLRSLARLTRRLWRRRSAAGSIDFDLPSAEILLGDEGHPVDIVEAPRTVAHRAVEEAMLVANRAVAESLTDAGLPVLYRIHEAPSPADMETLRELLVAFGLLRGREARALPPRAISEALGRVAGRPEERLIHQVTLRSMRQARYSARNPGHFALAFDHYTHFTSPIRRYADLVVHRVLKDLLTAGESAARRAARRARRMDVLGTRLSWCERRAMDAEREMVDLKKCIFMTRHVGEAYEGTLTGVARHGFYVTLDPFFVEGLVHVSTLPAYAVFDERNHALALRGSRERFRLGDRVRVAVDRVDLRKGWINFSLLERLPRS